MDKSDLTSDVGLRRYDDIREMIGTLAHSIGTITGVAIEPQKGHRLPGLKNLQESRIPAILDPDLIDEVINVPDELAYATTRRLFHDEGLIVGPPTGAISWAAEQFGSGKDGIVVGISPDSGYKYASYFTEILDQELPRT